MRRVPGGLPRFFGSLTRRLGWTVGHAGLLFSVLLVHLDVAGVQLNAWACWTCAGYPRPRTNTSSTRVRIRTGVAFNWLRLPLCRDPVLCLFCSAVPRWPATLDAICCQPEPADQQRCGFRALSECARVLRPDGVFVLVSVADWPERRDMLSAHFRRVTQTVVAPQRFIYSCQGPRRRVPAHGGGERMAFSLESSVHVLDPLGLWCHSRSR